MDAEVRSADYPFVPMVSDPQTEKQAGFALSAELAREMAAGLVKYADALANHEASKSNQIELQRTKGT